MVYDVGSRKTFESVDIWMRMIQEQADSSVALILVGNKCDLSESEREVSDDEGRALATKFGIPFHSTSAKGNTGVDEAFLDIVTRVMASYDQISPRGNSRVTVNENHSQARRRRGRCC